MPHIHYRTQNADAVGAAAAAVQNIATFETSDKATDLIACVVQKANSGVRTTAESTQGKFIINAGKLLPDLMTIQSGMADGGGPATQSQGLVEYPKWVPIKVVDTARVGVKKQKVIMGFDACVPDPTAVFCAQGSIVYAEGNYPRDVLENVDTLATRIKWSDTTTEPDLGNAVMEVFPDTITVPGWVEEIVAIGITISPDAILTTAQHHVGYIEISGTIPGLYPMQIPIPSIHAALAGTVVGGCVVCEEFILPMYIKHTSKHDATLTFTAYLNAITSLTAVTVNLYGR